MFGLVYKCSFKTIKYAIKDIITQLNTFFKCLNWLYTKN